MTKYYKKTKQNKEQKTIPSKLTGGENVQVSNHKQARKKRDFFLEFFI